MRQGKHEDLTMTSTTIQKTQSYWRSRRDSRRVISYFGCEAILLRKSFLVLEVGGSWNHQTLLSVLEPLEAQQPRSCSGQHCL